MSKSQMIEEFIQDADDTMLRELLEIYNQSLELSDDAKIQRLADKLASLFEESSNVS